MRHRIYHRIHHRAATLWRALLSLTGSNAPIVVTPPSGRLRAARILVALATLTFVYQGYALMVVPWVEPPPPPNAGSYSSAAPQRLADPELAALFPEGAWERSNPMVLSTHAGKLLFQDFQRSEDGRIELRPCTIVFHAPLSQKEGGKTQRPVILQTPDKAVLSFSESPDFMSGRIGKLQGALLEGQVRIYSAETQPGANDALMITTRSIQILPRQIWTPHDVVFQYGSSHGSGRDLTIMLASERNDDSAPAHHALVQSIESLELAHVDKLLLDMPGTGLLADLSTPSGEDPAGTELAPLSPPASTAVEVTCQGPFRFNFQKGVAQLEDQVDVVRANAGGPSDQLNCQTLRIHFQTAQASPAGQATTASADAGPPPGPGSTTGPQSTLPKLAVRSIEALGWPVTLLAPSVEASARGQALQYDFVTRRILLQDENKASFVYRRQETQAFKLEYALPEDPQRLGRLVAVGPGVFQGVFGELSDQRLEATWNGSLELYPQDDLHVLSVADGATVRWNEMGKFSADKLYIWLAEVADPAGAQPVVIRSVSTGAASNNIELNGPATNTRPEPPSEGSHDVLPPAADAVSNAPSQPLSGTPRRRVEVQPVKMLAEGNVQADSPQFRGNTPRLEIWFDHPSASGPSPAPAPPAEGDSVAPPEAAADKRLSASQAKRLELSGNYIRLRLLMIQPRPVVREATVLGQVRLAQVALLSVETVPLLVSGDMLQLRTDALDRSTVDVHGEPARVHIQGMLLEGSDLRVSQRENRMEADGPGRMTLPARSNQDSARTASPHRLTSSSPIWISWQGGMDFDGQLVRFLKQVEVRGIYTSKAGERMHLESIGDQLHALLNRYVAFDRTKQTDGLDVMELRFLGDVFTANQTFDTQDIVTSQERMKTRDLNLDRSTGKFTAAGPGWITSTRVDKKGSGNPLGAPPSAGPSRAPLPAVGPQKLVYLRIDYENEIRGNLDLREGEFVHFVRTVYGPVASWDETIESDRPGGLGPQCIVMTCNRLFVAQTGEEVERAMEMSATGNTVVEGNAFLAKADRLSYAQAKDLLVLEGTGRSFASLQHRSRPGEKPAEFVAQKIMYWLATGQHEEFGVKQFDYNQVGAPQLPSARLR